LDAIGNWTSTNNMKLNPKKCKEMIVSFRRDIEQPPPTLVVENISLERIESHKVLG
jgi:tRNA U55 pseudouridine synthase TruB